MEDSTPGARTAMAEETERLARMETTLEIVKEQVGNLVGSIAIVSQVQADLSHTRDALGRAFVRLEAHEETIKKHQEDCRNRHDDAAANTRKLEMRVNVYVASVSGIMLGVSAAMGLLAWVVSNNIVGALQAVAKASGAN